MEDVIEEIIQEEIIDEYDAIRIKVFDTLPNIAGIELNYSCAAVGAAHGALRRQS